MNMLIRAVWLLGQGGYHRDAVVHGVEVLQRIHQKMGDHERAGYLRSHPVTSKRMRNVLKERERYESIGLGGLALEANRRKRTSKRDWALVVTALAIVALTDRCPSKPLPLAHI